VLILVETGASEKYWQFHKNFLQEPHCQIGYHYRDQYLGRFMIKQVGSTPVNEYHRLTCHCGAVVLELHLPNGIVDPRRCDCSLCRRRGAIVASANLTDIRILNGKDQIKLYQFNTMTAKHYFCSSCGVYTHHRRRSNPNEYSYNVACLEGVNPFELGEIPTRDGINHPADRK